MKRRLLDTVERGSGATRGPKSPGVPIGTVREIAHLLRELAGSGVIDELLTVGRGIETRAPELGHTFQAWAEVVDTLVHDAETRHPRGRGDLKRREVKWVVRYLLESEEIQFGPVLLRPLLIDAAADIMIDGLVVVLKDHDALVAGDASKMVRATGTMRWWWFRLGQALGWVARAVGAALGRLYVALRFHRPVSPVLRSALAALEQDRKEGRAAHLVEPFVELFEWLGQHPDVFRTASRLVALSVSEAEQFSTLDGPDKKAYAENTIMAVLQDIGMASGILGSVITRVFVDLAIDAVVTVFNKQGIFEHGKHKTGQPVGS